MPAAARRVRAMLSPGGAEPSLPQSPSYPEFRHHEFLRSPQGNTGKPLKPKPTGEPRLPLDAIFRPRSVAVIGATETAGSVGRTILWNLISNPFGATVFPVNPKRSNVLGIRAYKSVERPARGARPRRPGHAGAVRARPDHASAARLACPAPWSSPPGSRRPAPTGRNSSGNCSTRARRYRMRVIGPNCLGVMSPVTGLNATFAAAMARPGNVGFLSQSGALCTAVLDWSFRENVGFSHFVSIGSMVDVGLGRPIDYLGHDARTRSIVIYMESIGDARSFMSAAREVALSKPIIVIKAGRTQRRGQGGGLAYRRADRQRRGARRRIPPIGRAPRGLDRRAVLHGGGAVEAAAPAWAAADHPHQCRRAGRARHRRLDRQRRAS